MMRVIAILLKSGTERATETNFLAEYIIVSIVTDGTTLVKKLQHLE